MPIIDVGVHVFFPGNDDLRGFMHEPYKSRGFPDYEMDWYGAPGGEYVAWAKRDGMYPGSDPDFTVRQLFGERKIDLAILHPMTRRMMPDRQGGHGHVRVELPALACRRPPRAAVRLDRRAAREGVSSPACRA